METAQSSIVAPYASELADVEAAIALVAGGAAVRVRLACLPAPLAVAARGAALAQAAGVTFRLARDVAGAISIEVGPRLGPVAVGDA